MLPATLTPLASRYEFTCEKNPHQCWWLLKEHFQYYEIIEYYEHRWFFDKPPQPLLHWKRTCDSSASCPGGGDWIGYPAHNPIFIPAASLSLSVHNSINTQHERALDLACITKILLEYAAGPLSAQLSPAGTPSEERPGKVGGGSLWLFVFPPNLRMIPASVHTLLIMYSAQEPCIKVKREWAPPSALLWLIPMWVTSPVVLSNILQ